MADWGLDALAADASVQASQAQDDLRTISARDVEALEKCSDDVFKLADNQWYDNAGGDEGEVGADGDCASGFCSLPNEIGALCRHLHCPRTLQLMPTNVCALWYDIWRWRHSAQMRKVLIPHTI